MAIDMTRIGKSRDSEEFRVNTARPSQFAAAVNDVNPAHLSGAIAHPVFHHIPVMQSMVELLSSVTRPFALHGEHDLHFHHPIEPGQRLYSVSKLISIRPTKAGTAILIRSETRTHIQLPVSTQYSTCLVTSETVAAAEGETAPERPEPSRDSNPITDTRALSDDQTRRYAEAARDYSTYTLDVEAARKLGFSAPIVHGMCTLAFAASAIIDKVLNGKTCRLARLGGRFANPLLMVPKQVLTTRLWAGPPKNGRRIVGFETIDRDGGLAIKNGFAEVLA